LEADPYWIEAGLRPTGKQRRKFIFARGARDYDERDRLVLELLQSLSRLRSETAAECVAGPARGRHRRAGRAPADASRCTVWRSARPPARWGRHVARPA